MLWNLKEIQILKKLTLNYLIKKLKKRSPLNNHTQLSTKFFQRMITNLQNDVYMHLNHAF